MKTYKLHPQIFRNVITKLSGMVFYRIDGQGNHLVKPLKSVEPIIIRVGGIEFNHPNRERKERDYELDKDKGKKAAV